MRTTIDLSDGLFKEAKKLAVKRGMSLKGLIELGLRQLLQPMASGQKAFKLKNVSFKGKGLQEGLHEGRWSEILSRAYEGRGG